ncbi:amino acid adenylation domain-containing protein [Streptomyces sp. SID10815]|uniref:non-ribosomal peptide synthetase n=1 Tax=Streptomyces sp. SID10815 TaxID=2706027 RepID=UPI0013C7BD8A|nr:amino acid adenylation domain-containing protein [Streptomyces sp. SID10815]NEA47255.1 amino acid adenylation domain-containing protein [Streptomyces sp. SID10815]
MTRRSTATAAGPAVAPQTTVETIPQAFTRTARQHAAREALRDGATTLTYAELDAATDRIARALRERGLRPGQRIAVRLDRGPALYQVFLGVLKAGCVVVPFNPGHPAPYTARMHRLAAPALTVTDSDAAPGLPAAARQLPVGDLLAEAEALPAEAVDAEVTPEAPAFTLFTSGSTGEPKGVVIAHRGIARVSRGLTGFTPGPQDRFLQLAQPSFAASTTDIWTCLLRGGRLSLAPQELPQLGELAALIARERTTVLNLPVGLFNLLVEHHPDTLAQTRSVIVSGDFPSAAHLERALAVVGGDLFNAFGCTENSALTAVHKITPDDLSGAAVPVGRPMPGVEMTVRDDRFEECPPGEIGELCIGGDGVALGYLDDPDLTDRKFVPHRGGRLLRTGDLARRTEDGEIVLAGRTDQMLKVRGFRIEPRQVELTAESHPDVERAVAQAAPSDGAADRLALWCVPAPGRELAESALLDHLRRHLPDHLVPATVRVLDAFPLNANGKIDRKELAARLTARPRAATPDGGSADRLAETVRATLAEVTGQDPIGPDDGLIENGVTSLHLIDLGARLEDVAGVALAPDEIFDAGTPRGVADLIRTQRARG